MIENTILQRHSIQTDKWCVRYVREIASDYQLKGVTLEKVSRTPYLEVSISENLEWGGITYPKLRVRRIQHWVS